MLRALIVDDDAINSRFIREILDPYAECELADNGAAGFAAFERSLETGAPYDVILMDIMMPGMDGHQTLEKIRDLERRRHVPEENAVKVIMISACDDMKNVSRAFFKGHALTFLNKPFAVQTLMEELRRFHFIE